MTDDLRDQLAAEVLRRMERVPFDTCAEDVADAILARFAVAGELRAGEAYNGGWIWDYDEQAGQVVHIRGGVIRYGFGYWNPAEGDSPLPLAAALIAAYRHTQEAGDA
jgi:hypothetical protein